VSSVVVDNIGLLVTNDSTVGSGPLGVRRRAAVVIDRGTVVAVGDAGSFTADRQVEADGRCVLPGFVDSHTHLVFAGDRADEFCARMAGQPYEAGGIRVSTMATRQADDDTLRRLLNERLAESIRAGITTTEIKTGYGLDVADEERCARLAAEVSNEVTFLGAHVVPAEYDGRGDAYVDLVVTAMLDAVAPHCRWIDAFCEVGAFDADQCRAVLHAGMARGLGGRLHGNQLGHGPGVQLAVEMGCASVDHCTYLDDDDRAALAGSDTVATFLPLTDFCTRQPYPDARRAVDAGCAIALATNCNPGSSNSTAIGLAIAFAVRDLGLTVDEAVHASTVGGARALRRTDVGHLGLGARGDLVILDAPSYTHLAYRPGVPLVGATLVGGVERWRLR
jgi:imidazolonepropionase